MSSNLVIQRFAIFDHQVEIKLGLVNNEIILSIRIKTILSLQQIKKKKENIKVIDQMAGTYVSLW